MSLVVIQTGDGSRTLFDTERNIYFRSLQGAQSESDYVFLQASRIQEHSNWRILELGLGTALNFLRTAEAFLNSTAGQLDYYAVESNPLDPQIFLALQHQSHLKHPWLIELVQEALERAQTEVMVSIQRGSVCLRIFAQDWQSNPLPDDLEVDAIYHDPFGPKENPDAWAQDCFVWEARYLSPQGRLVTYGAATAVRKAMVAAGLIVASLPGSGSKREMTVAAKSTEALSHTQILIQSKYV
jgi:tRNA U34 5-methylaminomethyl-2-thiouridine-forming methyltransferase MnmC